MTKNQSSQRLIGLKVLVTGATSGLGFSVSVALAEEADVIAVGRIKPLEGLSMPLRRQRGQ